MSFNELVFELKQLNRSEKIRMMQVLVFELAKDEGLQLISETEYPIYTPLDAYEAANDLMMAFPSSVISPSSSLPPNE